MYEDGDSFRRHVDLKRYGINPTAALLVGPDTRIDLSYEYFHDRRTADRGVPSDGDEPVRGFTRTFFGDPDDSYAKANVNIATLAVEHRVRRRPDAAATGRMFGDYDKFYQNIYASSAVLPATRRCRSASRSARTTIATTAQNLFSQTDLVWENRLGGHRPDVAVRLRARPRRSRATGARPAMLSAPASRRHRCR